jgi:Sortase domain
VTEEDRPRAARQRRRAAAIAAVSVLGAIGCGSSAKPVAVAAVRQIRFPPATGVAPSPTTAHVSGGVSVDLSGSPTRAAPTVGIPTKIDIPTLGVHAAVVALGRNPDGSLQVPQRFDTVGWYTETSRPGDPGPAVLAGHVDSYQGAAVFFRLNQLRPGDLVTVWSDTGPKRFRVESMASFAKDKFPVDAVFGPVPDTALRLVTCGGSFDRAKGSYRDNIVIYATEVAT